MLIFAKQILFYNFLKTKNFKSLYLSREIIRMFEKQNYIFFEFIHLKCYRNFFSKVLYLLFN